MDNMTAKVSCFARAYHYKNNTTHIFKDTAAEALLGNDYGKIAQSMTQGSAFSCPTLREVPRMVCALSSTGSFRRQCSGAVHSARMSCAARAAGSM